MVKFLTTLILAIIIFVPACMFASKMFQFGAQANDNYLELADEIKTLAKGIDGQQTQFLLILDERSMVVLFAKNESLIITHDLEFRSRERYFQTNVYTLKYPQIQCANEPCLCLCKDYEMREQIVCKTLQCQILKDIKFIDSWYSLRETVEGPRRTTIELKKQNDLINITGGQKLVDIKHEN